MQTDNLSKKRIYDLKNDLKNELKTAKEELQNVVEELETSNEELQLTNEELIASNEELQSANEELYTVNAELQERNKEQLDLNNDVTNLLNSTEIGTLFLDSNLRIRKFTPALQQHFELKEDDIGRPITSFASNFKESVAKSIVEDAQQTLDNSSQFERATMDKNGNYFLQRFSPYTTSDKKIEGVVITFVDITQIEIAYQQLTKSQEELNQRAKELEERVKETKCLYGVTESIRTRVSLEEIFDDVVNIIPPGWQYPENTKAKVVFDTKEYVSEPFIETEWKQSTNITVNGKQRGIIEVYYLEERPERDDGPFLKEEGKLIKNIAIGISEAIEKKQIEESLIEERERQLAIFDGVEDVMYVSDPDTYELLHVNETFKNTWDKDAKGQLCHKVIHNQDMPCSFCTNHIVFGEKLGQTHVWENQNQVNNKWYRHSDKAIDWIDGRKVRFEQITDITTIKENEEKLKEVNQKLVASEHTLKEKEERYFLATTASESGIWDWWPQANKLYYSDQWKALLGYKPDELEDTFETWEFLLHPDQKESLKKKIMDFMDNPSETYTAEFLLKHKDGSYRWILNKSTAIVNEKNEVIRMFGAHTDITEQKLAKAKIKSQLKEIKSINEKLENYSYTISHDLKEPIRSIRTFSEFIST